MSNIQKQIEAVLNEMGRAIALNQRTVLSVTSVGYERYVVLYDIIPKPVAGYSAKPQRRIAHLKLSDWEVYFDMALDGCGVGHIPFVL